jgi:TP901 family phage tail tape measure protein
MANPIDLGDLVYNLGFSSEAEFVTKLEEVFKAAEEKAKEGGANAGQAFNAALAETEIASAGENLGDQVTEGFLESIGKITLGSFLGNALSSAFEGATAVITEFVVGSVEEFKKYDAALVTLRQQGVTNLDAVDQSLTKLSNSSKVFSETELAGSLGSLVQDGLAAADAMKILEAGAILAAGSLDPLTGQFADVAATSTGLSDTLRSLGLGFDQTSRVADVLALAAAKSGTNIEGMVGAVSNLGGIANTIKIPVEELAANIATLTNVGYSAQESSTGLNTVIAALISPTGVLKEQADALGLSFVRADGSTRSLNEVMRNVGIQAEKGGNGLKLLKEVGIDTYGLKVASALGQTTDRTRELTSELQNATGSAEKFAAVAGDSVPADVKKMEVEIKNSQKTLGEQLVPIMKVFYTTVAPILVTAVGLVAKAFEGWRLIIELIGDALKSLGSSTVEQLGVAVKQVDFLEKRMAGLQATLANAQARVQQDPNNQFASVAVTRLTATIQALQVEINAAKAEVTRLQSEAKPPVPKPAPKPPAALPPAPSGNSSSSSNDNPASLLATQTEAQRKFNKALEDAVKAYESGKTAALDAFVVEQRRIYNLALAAAKNAQGDAAQEAAKKALQVAASNLEKAESALDRERDQRAKRIKQREEEAARDAKKNEEERKKALEDAKKAQQELEAAIARVNAVAADQRGKDVAEKFTAAIINGTDAKLRDLRVAVELEEQAARAALAVAVQAAQIARSISNVEARNAALAKALSDATGATTAISDAQERYNQVLNEQEKRLQAVFDQKLENAGQDETALTALVASSTKAVEEAKKQLASSKNIKEATEAYKNAVERLTTAEKALATAQRAARQAQLDLSAARRADAREVDINNASIGQLQAAQVLARNAVTTATTVEELDKAKVNLARIEAELTERYEAIQTIKDQIAELTQQNLDDASQTVKDAIAELQNELDILTDNETNRVKDAIAELQDELDELKNLQRQIDEAVANGGDSADNLARVDTEPEQNFANTLALLAEDFSSGLFTGGTEGLQNLSEILLEFLEKNLPESIRSGALALKAAVDSALRTSKPSELGDGNPIPAPNENSDVSKPDELKGEFTGLGRSFVDSIIEGIRSGDMSKAFENILGNASSYFLNKVIDGILGDVASSLASAVAKSATANTAAGAAGSAGALGALGPAGLIIGGVALLGSLFLGAANQPPKIPNAARDSSFGRDSSSPAISYNATANVTFAMGGNMEDPAFRAAWRQQTVGVVIDVLKQVGLVDSAKAGGI